MNQLILSKPSNNRNSGCVEIMRMAEHELSAFVSAVTELFGSKQAELSAEDWLHELTAIDGLPASTREWELITAKASTQLASRVNASSFSAERQVFRRKGLCVFSSQVP